MNCEEKYSAGLELYYHTNTMADGLTLLKEAMQEGSGKAALTVGMHYLNEKDYITANKCFEIGAGKGEGNCFYLLACAYGTPGKGKEVDDIKAFEMLQKAREHGCKVEEDTYEMYKKCAEQAAKLQRKGIFKKLFRK